MTPLYYDMRLDSSLDPSGKIQEATTLFHISLDRLRAWLVSSPKDRMRKRGDISPISKYVSRLMRDPQDVRYELLREMQTRFPQVRIQDVQVERYQKVNGTMGYRISIYAYSLDGSLADTVAQDLDLQGAQ